MAEANRPTLVNVPIVPKWNLSNGCVCTPDGGFLYVGARSINYMSRIVHEEQAPIIKVFQARQNVVGVDVDPAWGRNDTQQKQFVVLSEDNSLQIWDFVQGCPLIGHKVHTPAGRYIDGGAMRENVLFGYMRNSNVLSLDAQDVVVYCVVSNSYCKLPTFLPTRSQRLKALRCSPYNEHIFAVGTARGTVLVCDLQRKTVVYTLRGHDAAITSLSWMRISTQSKKPSKLLTKTKAIDVGNSSSAAGDDEDIFDIYDYDYLEQEFGAPTAASGSKDKHDSLCDSVGEEKTALTNHCEQFDYVEACQSLKDDMIINQAQQQQGRQDECVITLAECQQAAELQEDAHSYCSRSSEHAGDSGEADPDDLSMGGSRSSSDDSLAVDGMNHKRKSQILHQAEVHAVQTQTLERSSKKEPPTEETDKHADMEMPEKPLNHTDSEKQQLQETSTVVAETTEDILLASASLDGYFWIWNTKTGSACDSLKARTVSQQQGKNTHLEIAWLNATSFLTSNKHGEVAQWVADVQQCDEPSVGPGRIYKFKENRAFLLQDSVVGFAVCQESDAIWCISARREVVCRNIASGKLLAQYSCVPTNISAMCECPNNMNQIALACPDRRIGVIDMSSLSPTRVAIKNYSLRIDAVVTALAWSPDSKKIAFATAEGRVST